MIDRIIDLLEQLCNSYQSIYELSEKKKQQIKEGDSQAISDTVKEEWPLLGEANRQEEQRDKLTREFLSASGADAGDATIDALKAYATPAQWEKISDVSARLKELLNRQRLLNDENKALIELHLEYINFMMDNVFVEQQVSNVYGNTGNVEDYTRDNRGFIDNQA